MKIVCHHSPNFGIQRLYRAKIKDTAIENSPKDIDVFISELEESDIKDFKNNNSDLNCTTMGEKCLLNFTQSYNENKKYFVVEDAKQPFDKRFKGILLAEPQNGFTYISRLQSISETASEKYLKGIGSCLIYAVTKFAQSKGDKCVTLDAQNDSPGFYHKIGFLPIIPMGSHFLVHHTKYNDVLEPIKEKFQISEYKNRNNSNDNN